MKKLLIALGIFAPLCYGVVTIKVTAPEHAASVDIPATGRIEMECRVVEAGTPIRDVSIFIMSPPFNYYDDGAAVWCMAGPGKPIYSGCAIYDEDWDLDVDLRDFALRHTKEFWQHSRIESWEWPVCMSGPGKVWTWNPECWRLDLDGDMDVDLRDFASSGTREFWR